VRRGDEEDAAHIWYWLDEYGPDATVRAVLVERSISSKVCRKWRSHPIAGADDHLPWQEDHPGYGRGHYL